MRGVSYNPHTINTLETVIPFLEFLRSPGDFKKVVEDAANIVSDLHSAVGIYNTVEALEKLQADTAAAKAEAKDFVAKAQKEVKELREKAQEYATELTQKAEDASHRATAELDAAAAATTKLQAAQKLFAVDHQKQLDKEASLQKREAAVIAAENEQKERFSKARLLVGA